MLKNRFEREHILVPKSETYTVELGYTFIQRTEYFVTL